jgi:ATP-binding cassette subfamily B (MDR/TAP) protein 1
MTLGQEAAFRMFKVIDRKPLIDVNDETKIKVSKLKGNIELRDVKFNFPNNLEKNIL